MTLAERESVCVSAATGMFATIADYAKLGSIFLNVSAPASETLSLFDTANTFNNLPAGGVNHASIVHDMYFYFELRAQPMTIISFWVTELSSFWLRAGR